MITFEIMTNWKYWNPSDKSKLGTARYTRLPVATTRLTTICHPSCRLTTPTLPVVLFWYETCLLNPQGYNFYWFVFPCIGVRLYLCGSAACNGPICVARVMDEWRGMIQKYRSVTCSSAISLNTNLTLFVLGAKSDLCGGKRVTNRLSLGTTKGKNMGFFENGKVRGHNRGLPELYIEELCKLR